MCKESDVQERNAFVLYINHIKELYIYIRNTDVCEVNLKNSLLNNYEYIHTSYIYLYRISSL